MSTCPDCGTTTSAEHAFCLNCGRELERDEPAIVPPPAQQTSASDVSGRPYEGSAMGGPTSMPTDAGGGGWASSPQHPERGRAATAGMPPQPPRRPGLGVIVPPAAALFVSLALQQAISTVIPPDAYITRLFRPNGGWLMGVVPALIGFAFVWTLTDLILKFRIAVTNERDFARPEIRHLPGYVAQGASEVALQRLRSWDRAARGRPVARRVVWILQHLEATDPARAHELVRHQSDLEADSTASGYRTVKLFIWAMPILGFIGTVLGISLAVGGFSDFLTTSVSIDQVDAVTAELAEVASGLSFAFDTTLLGLLGGLVASVVSSGVQAREERLLTRLEELGLRILETGGPSDESQTAVASAVGAELEAVMKERVQELSSQMDRFSEAVRSSFDLFLERWAELPERVALVGSDLGALRQQLVAAAEGSEEIARQTRAVVDGLGEASAALAERVDTSIATVDETARGLGSALETSAEKLTESLSAVTDRLADSDARLRAAVEGLARAVESSHEGEMGVVEAQAQTERTLGTLSDAFTRSMSTLSQSLTESDDRLRAAVEGLSEAVERNGGAAGGDLATEVDKLAKKLAESLEGLGGRLDESDDRLRAAIEKLASTIARSHEEGDDRAEAQRAIEQTLAELTESMVELGATMKALQEAQAALAPLVAKLSGPLELKLVPPG